MKIFIDMGHPAHVHYFRNFISIMKSKGHEFCITARDKEITHNLLRAYNLDFVNRGKGKKNLIGKFLYTIKADYLILRHARKFIPDIFLSFSSPYAAHISKLLKRPHIAFDDTEHAVFSRKFYLPFTDVVLTPKFFNASLGKKQKKFDGFMELTYLHPNYFTPDPSIYNYLKIDQRDKYVFLRFISWEAYHDKRHHGISEKIKINAVREFSKVAKVFISSEGNLPNELEKYRLNIPEHLIHHVLYYASLYFGESGTMATESAILGTPTVRVSSLAKFLGNFKELNEKYHLIEYYDSDEEGFKRAYEILMDNNSKAEWKRKAKSLLRDKIDVTQFMIDFICDRSNYG